MFCILSIQKPHWFQIQLCIWQAEFTYILSKAMHIKTTMSTWLLTKIKSVNRNHISIFPDKHLYLEVILRWDSNPKWFEDTENSCFLLLCFSKLLLYFLNTYFIHPVALHITSACPGVLVKRGPSRSRQDYSRRAEGHPNSGNQYLRRKVPEWSWGLSPDARKLKPDITWGRVHQQRERAEGLTGRRKPLCPPSQSGYDLSSLVGR